MGVPLQPIAEDTEAVAGAGPKTREGSVACPGSSCRLLCPWPYDPADLMVLEVSAAERMLLRAHDRPWRGITAKALGILEQALPSPCR